MIPVWLTKAATPVIAAAVLIATAALLCWLMLRTIDGMIDDARAGAIAERNAYWTAEIAKSEAATQMAIAENLKSTMAAQDAARSHVAAVEAQLAQLETDNAALPDSGACGLGRDRVRLLNKQ